MPQIATREDACRMALRSLDQHMRTAGLEGQVRAEWLQGRALCLVACHQGVVHSRLLDIFDADAARLGQIGHEMVCRLTAFLGLAAPRACEVEPVIYRGAVAADMDGFEPEVDGLDLDAALGRMGVELIPRARGVLLRGHRTVEIPHEVARHPGWVLAAAQAASRG